MTRLLVLLSLGLSFGSIGHAALQFDNDVPAAVKTQFVNDLALINQIQGSSTTPLHKEIFGAVAGADYKKFFEKRIQNVGLDACGGGSMVSACVMPFQDPHKMWLTTNFTGNSIPQIARLMIVYHEARHSESENGNWSHASCPIPFLDKNGKDVLGIVSGMKLEGQDACDETVYGSYGSSTIMVKNIQKYCTNCTDKLKMDASIWADDQAKRITDPEAAAALAADFQK